MLKGLQYRVTQLAHLTFVAALIAFFTSPAMAIVIDTSFAAATSDNPSYDADGSRLIALMDAAAGQWEDTFEDNWTIQLEFLWEDLDDASGTLALCESLASNHGKPTSARIRVDTQSYGVNRPWYIDATPDDNGEYLIQQRFYCELSTTQQTDYFVGSPPDLLEVGAKGTVAASAPSEARNGIDLLSVLLHELGHAVGMNGLVAWQETSDDDYDFTPGQIGYAAMAAKAVDGDHYHLADTQALMYPSMSYGLRTLPSAVDALSIATAVNWNVVDLPRKEFLTGSAWVSGPSWIGGQVPDAEDEVSIRHGGTVTLSSGLAECDTLRLGVDGDGDLQQTGGTFRAAQVWVGSANPSFAGGFIVSAGQFEAETLTVDATGSFAVAPAAEISISEAIVLRDGSQLTSAPGSSIHLVGADFVNENEESDARVGLANLSLVFEGGTGGTDTLEIAAEDLGPTYRGFRENVVLGSLQVGGIEGTSQVQLVDQYDNRPDSTATEALYVNTLALGTGSDLDLNGLNLYYLDKALLAPAADPGGGLALQLNQWKLTGGGTYHSASNWTADTIPNGADVEANFLDRITGPATIILDAPTTLGTINFDSAQGYAVTGTGALTMQSTTGDARVDVWNGDHSLAVPLSLQSDLTVWTEGTSSLGLDLGGMGIMNTDLTKQGGGTWTVSGGLAILGDISVEEGTMEIGPNLLSVSTGNPIAVAAGATLKVSGSVNRHVTGALGESYLEAVGPTDIGLSTTDGYDFQGRLDVGANTVGLKDADMAKLYGATIDGGTLSSFNGIEIQPFGGSLDRAITGNGTINGYVQLSRPGEAPAIVAGTTGIITMTGTVKGNANTANVVTTGLYKPGFSPSFGVKGFTYEGASIGSSTEIQLLGPNGAIIPEGEPLSLFSEIPPGDYTQFYVGGNVDVAVGKFILYDYDPMLGPSSSHYAPQAGDRFDIIVTGPYDAFGTILDNVALTYENATLDGLFDMTNTAPLAEGLEWRVEAMPDRLTLTVVPEPGTLILLLTGGLGLALAVWRRK